MSVNIPPMVEPLLEEFDPAGTFLLFCVGGNLEPFMRSWRRVAFKLGSERLCTSP